MAVMIRPTAPTIIRITPAVPTLNPCVLWVVTANRRIAPRAMRKRLAPIRIGPPLSGPPRRPCDSPRLIAALQRGIPKRRRAHAAVRNTCQLPRVTDSLPVALRICRGLRTATHPVDERVVAQPERRQDCLQRLKRDRE